MTPGTRKKLGAAGVTLLTACVLALSTWVSGVAVQKLNHATTIEQQSTRKLAEAQLERDLLFGRLVKLEVQVRSARHRVVELLKTIRQLRTQIEILDIFILGHGFPPPDFPYSPPPPTHTPRPPPSPHPSPSRTPRPSPTPTCTPLPVGPCLP